MRLRGQEDLAAALAEGGAVVIAAAGVGRGGIEVVHALVERPLDDTHGLPLLAVGAQHALAAETEERGGVAGTAEGSAGERGVGGHRALIASRATRLNDVAKLNEGAVGVFTLRAEQYQGARP